MRRILAISAVALTLAACATTSQRSARSEFEDIPVPKGLALDADKSTIIESPTVKAARLIYKGRIEPGSLAAAMRSTLEANGWRTLSSTTSSDKGTTQVYDKGSDTLQVMIYEGIWDTYLELAGTRVLSPGGGAQPVAGHAMAPAQIPAVSQAQVPPPIQASAPGQVQQIQPLIPVPAPAPTR